MSAQDWDAAVAVNYTAIYNSVAVCLPHMLEHGEGSQIVCTSSMSGILPGGNLGVYTATKIAAVGLMEALRVELEGTTVGTSAFVPGGVNHDEWLPKTEGVDYQPGKTLAALAPVREHVLVLSGLNARHGEVGANGHPLGTAPWLSSAPINDKDRGGYCTDISVDQLIANQVGQDTRLPSLELGRDSDSRSMHETNISWRGPASPMGKETNPRAVYSRLFGDPEGGSRGRRLLDLVLEDAQAVRQRLGQLDRQKLDEYLDSVRSIERRIERSQRDNQANRPPQVDLPDTIPAQ